ncbi:MAG: TVP38/TMEM64 family protein, partial [Pseudomonadota bacterium]
AISGHLASISSQIMDVLENRDTLRSYVESWGTLAPFAFVMIQILQVLLAPIPGEFTGAVGGFIFGVWPNVIYSTIGLTIGSMLAFMASKAIGMPIVKYFVSDEHLRRFHFLTERKGAIISLVLFAIPGVPKDILSYILGLSPMGVWTFFWVSSLGRIPGTIMLSFSGSAIYDGDWKAILVLALVCAVIFIFVFYQRERIEEWIRRKHSESR